jgi:hypothetical protein
MLVFPLFLASVLLPVSSGVPALVGVPASVGVTAAVGVTGAARPSCFNIPSLTDVSTGPCVFLLLLASTAVVWRAFPAVLVVPCGAVRRDVDVFLVLLFLHLSLSSIPVHSTVK